MLGKVSGNLFTDLLISLVEYCSISTTNGEVTNIFIFDKEMFPLNWMIGCAETDNLCFHVISVFVISKGKYLFPEYVHVFVKADVKKLSAYYYMY